jgi:hypothetical protein
VICPDVNVLVYAHRTDAEDHAAYAHWLTEACEGRQPFALSSLVLGGFLRIVTNPRIFREPTPPTAAVAVVDELLDRPQCRVVHPGPPHMAILRDLMVATSARGALVADLQHAAVAIEHGLEWVTNDGDFGRIPGLRARHPLRA